jgi:MFS family permease
VLSHQHLNQNCTAEAVASATGIATTPTLKNFQKLTSNLLKESRWLYDQIGVATALLGLGTLLFQTPAGTLVDRIKSRRLPFFVAAIAVGVCFGVIPSVPRTAVWITHRCFSRTWP